MSITQAQFHGLDEGGFAVLAGAASLERRGDSYVMSAPKNQKHFLAVAATDLARLSAHWTGFSGRYPLPARRAKGLTLTYDRDCGTFFVVAFGYRASLAAAADQGFLNRASNHDDERKLTGAQMDIVHEWAALEDNYLADLAH
ncbi:hypothetical protein [Roseibium sp. RKSG952]|uniref:hypothetical protein n=1 Tax=Roseibium sp. RKSG952 TaxID=2529384 RepID=UPI0012BD2BA9|nr:hypothetical protein [Roseibium sp. RKSG952]MTH95718.1 hypothetical protein [Roseibium sp. RKSG952]